MRDRWKKKAYYTVVLILTALCLISGCGQESGEELKEISLEETQEEKEESSAEEKKVEDKEPKKETKIFVYLCGAVGKPGVYEVGSDDRLYEVIAMAGGLTAEAAQDAVNQARVVVDGEQIYIPTKEEMQTQAAAAGGKSGRRDKAARRKSQSQYGDKRGTDDVIRCRRVPCGQYYCLSGRERQIPKYRRADADQRNQRRSV
jgi:hypothetical protein